MFLDGAYLLQYASIPFVSDVGRLVRMHHAVSEIEDASRLPALKHQPEEALVDEIERLLQRLYLNDITLPAPYAGRNLGALASPFKYGPDPEMDQVRVGEWYYPNTATRWSIFRGLATSAMVKAMVDATNGGLTAATFIMAAAPTGPSNKAQKLDPFTLTTGMYMLPPRPIGEQGGKFDGLYMVTLVDERYHWQSDGQTFKVRHTTTWDELLTSLATTLGITLTYSAIDAAYVRPEPDSQLWVNLENAAFLLDAVAYNLGRVVVRRLDGTYRLLTYAESRTQAQTNRGNALRVVRMAGGDLFTSGTLLPVGNLSKMRESVVPSSVDVTFPYYVQGNDPVPHFLNSRYNNQRRSCWYEESYGSVYTVNVPIASGGPLVSGLTGVEADVVHTTAKALISGEAQTTPINSSGLTALAVRLARDHYEGQVGAALDEVYPGTVDWTTEGFHDILWRYSDHARQASTRVMRTEWNQTVWEFQHGTPPISGYTNTPAGIGGPSVAQSHRDSYSVSGSITTQLNSGGLLSGDHAAIFNGVGNFPTQNRWRGQVDAEIILFEGTSGGSVTTNLSGNALSGQSRVNIVYRGIDGTIQTEHTSGAVITQLLPNAIYGVNLVTYEKMQFVHPQQWQSGGIQGVNFVPQTQSVKVLCGDGLAIDGVTFYSGIVNSYDATLGSGRAFVSGELIWIRERNDVAPRSGIRYDGQIAGYSSSGRVAPIYLIDEGSTDVIVPAGPSSGQTPKCNQLFYDGDGILKLWDCSANAYYYYCPCFPEQSGSGSGVANCNCAQCPDGSPPNWRFLVANATGVWADALGEWILTLSASCTWTQTRGSVTCTLTYNSTTGYWNLHFTNGANENFFRNKDPFLCCGENLFIIYSWNTSTFIDDVVNINPRGPCDPCPSGSGGSGGISVNCCPGASLPATLYATFSNGTATCSCVNGETVTLTYNGTDAWTGTYQIDSGGTSGPPTACAANGVNTMTLRCTIGGWSLSNTGPADSCSWLSAGLISTDCVSPISILFRLSVNETYCCTGIFDITITD